MLTVDSSSSTLSTIACQHSSRSQSMQVAKLPHISTTDLSFGDEKQRAHACGCNVAFDFRPIKILVYRNGDELDSGRTVNVTRREFKHWVVFLDGLTKQLRTTTAVHKLYTIDGRKIEHFEDLEQNGEYVAVEKGSFLPVDYGTKAEKLKNKETKFSVPLHGYNDQPHFLEGADAIDIYLKQKGYGSCTGLTYPNDGLVRSPSHSYLQSFAADMGGSHEKLNRLGREHSWAKSKEDLHTKLPPIGGRPFGATTTVTKAVKQSTSIDNLPRLDLRINLDSAGSEDDKKFQNHKNSFETYSAVPSKEPETILPKVTIQPSSSSSQKLDKQTLTEESMQLEESAETPEQAFQTYSAVPEEEEGTPPKTAAVGIQTDRAGETKQQTTTSKVQTTRTKDQGKEASAQNEREQTSRSKKSDSTGREVQTEKPVLKKPSSRVEIVRKTRMSREKLNRPKMPAAKIAGKEQEQEKSSRQAEPKSGRDEEKKRSQSQPREIKEKRSTWFNEDDADLDILLPPLEDPVRSLRRRGWSNEPVWRVPRTETLPLNLSEARVYSERVRSYNSFRKLRPLMRDSFDWGDYDPDFDWY